MHRHHM